MEGKRKASNSNVVIRKKSFWANTTLFPSHSIPALAAAVARFTKTNEVLETVTMRVRTLLL